MKHLFKMLVIAVLLTSKAFAQTDPVRTELDHIFQYIDKSQIPSGYLDEYGPQFAEKKWYNGVLADSNFIQFISGFRFLYNDIEHARIYSGATVLTSLNTLNNTINQLAVSNNTPLVFLLAKYATAKEDAINLNLFSNNGNNQILDVPGRSQSPYTEHNFFAAVPVAEDAPQQNSISLSYNPALVYSNCGKTISTVAVDFLKGSGYQTINPNSSVSYTYTDSSGYKKFAIKVTCTDGSIYYCYSQQFVKVINTTTNVAGRYAPLSQTELNNPAISIAAVPGEHYAAKVYIRYSKTREGTALANKLVKPFIVVEGYDLNDVAPLLDKENYTINSLIEEWEDIKDYDLREALDETAGYDLVFVQYYTMDYIENNTKMLEKVIDQLNTLKMNNAAGIREKNVVMGISLGGVLSRYTLAKMTKNRGTSSTDTRLLLTYDSPHQGGNVPLGFQHFLQDFGEVQIAGAKFKNESEQLKQFYTLNSQPATSQLLLLRATDANGSVQQNTFFASGGPYRTMVDFDATQMSNTPPSYEFKAISQGSQCGTWVMQPHTVLSSTSGNAATVRWVAFGLLTNKFKLTVDINALPAQGESKRISYIKMERNVRLFWGVIGTGWKTMYERSRFSPTNVIPYDCVPGGTSSALQRSGGGISSSHVYPFGSGDWYISNFWHGAIKPFLVLVSFSSVAVNVSVPFQQDIFTTVPINSSLDLQNVSTSTFNQSYIYPINGLAGSRSVKYIANESFAASVNGNSTTLYNYEHADFTKRQSQWMYNEMEGIDNSILNCEDAQSCSGTSFTITGNNFLCASESYALNPLPPTFPINWSVSQSGIVSLITNPDKSVTLSKLTDGIITLTGSSTICNNQVISFSKQIIVGSPAPEGIYFDPEDPLCINERFPRGVKNAYVFNPVPGTTYVWRVNNIVRGSGNPHLGIIHNNCVIGTNTVTVRSFRCGIWSAETVATFEAEWCEPEGFRMYSVSPNPSYGSVSVESKSTKTIEEVRVKDKLGNVKLSRKSVKGTKKVLLDLSLLPADIYFIEIFDGKEWHTEKVVKN
mgnify:CR=1 FL=1